MNYSFSSLLKINNVHIPISILCFLACLPLPAFYTGESFHPVMAYNLLSVGWLAALAGNISWFANPVFLLALLLANRQGYSSVLGFIALALAISFLFFREIPEREAGTVMSYGWGYCLWITALTVFSVG